MNEKIYVRKVDNICVQTAKLKSLLSGKFAFSTSLFGTKPYELNMNMPMFSTEKSAYNWIEQSGKWQLVTAQEAAQ